MSHEQRQTEYRPPEYDAVRHILGAPALEARTQRYVGDRDFDWVGLEREAATMSGGERFLLRIASDLWTTEKTIPLAEVPRRLDERNFRRVLEALRLARGQTTDLAA
jgi:ABC-type iron transport system FetAB ATPase subunit